MPTNFALYQAACAADDAYRDALVRVYGAKAAGDKRYLLNHSHPELQAAAAAKRAADDAWLAEMRRPAESALIGRIAKLRSNGARFIITAADDDTLRLTIQGWAHQDALSYADFSARYELIPEEKSV